MQVLTGSNILWHLADFTRRERTRDEYAIKKVLDDIQKTENKILELQEHVRQLRIQKKQMEDAEIIKAIRSMKMDSRKMLTFLDGIQNGTVTMQFDEEGNLSMDNSETGIKKEENMDSEMSTGLIEEREDLEDEE